MAEKMKGTAYDDTPSKKTVGLVVSMISGGMLQFPDGVKYCFDQVNGVGFLVVYSEEGKIAHIKVDCMAAVHGPATLFRDGRWK